MNTLAKLNSNIDLTGPATWERVKYWSESSQFFKKADVACQVMAGFDLAELKKAMKVKQGSRSDINFPSNLGSWEELVKKFASVSDETARIWIKMGEGMKVEMRKLMPKERFLKLMALPISQWPESEKKVLTDFVHKRADGKTQNQLLLEFGIVKGIGRNENPTGGPRGPALTPEEKAAIADPLIEIENNLFSLTDENDSTFAEVNSARLAKFQSVLSGCLDRVNDILKARKKAA